jgi:hypothetical protein
VAARRQGDRRRRLLDLGLQREAVTAARHGRHRLRPEHLAQGRDLHLQVVFLDDEPRPDQVEQLVLGEDAVAVVDERHEDVEGAAAERGRLALDEQLPLGRPDHHRPKTVGTSHFVSLAPFHRTDSGRLRHVSARFKDARAPRAESASRSTSPQRQGE